MYKGEKLLFCFGSSLPPFSHCVLCWILFSSVLIQVLRYLCRMHIRGGLHANRIADENKGYDVRHKERNACVSFILILVLIMIGNH